MKRHDSGIWTDVVMQAIDHIWKEKSMSPSMREIMEATGITTKSVVKYEYLRLAEQNKIDLVDGKPIPKWVISRLSKN